MKKYIVYGKSSCPYCIKVVNKLIRNGKTFYAEMLDDNPDRLEFIKKKYNHPTIPVVICKDEQEIFIGGCDDTIEHLSKGKSNETSKT